MIATRDTRQRALRFTRLAILHAALCLPPCMGCDRSRTEPPKPAGVTATRPADSAPSAAGNLMPPLHAGRIPGRIINVAVPDKVVEYTKTMQAAVARNPDWWSAYVKQSMPTEGPLPYHPNFGLTEEQYKEYLALAKQMELQEGAETSLLVQRTEEGTWTLNPGAPVGKPLQIEIDVKNRVAKTPYGTLVSPTEIRSGSGNAWGSLGEWEGLEWKMREGAPESGRAKLVTLRLGRLLNSNRGILLFEARVLDIGKPAAKVGVFMTFSLTR
jgi:hypothetical protein